MFMLDYYEARILVILELVTLNMISLFGYY